MQVPRKLEEDIGFPGAGVTGSLSHHVGGPNPGPLQEHQVLSAVESSSQNVFWFWRQDLTMQSRLTPNSQQSLNHPGAGIIGMSHQPWLFWFFLMIMVLGWGVRQISVKFCFAF